MKKWKHKTIVLLFWLTVWQLVALAVNNSVLVASPLQTLRCFWELLWTPEFYQTVVMSLGRIGLGFLTGLFTAVVLAMLSKRYPVAEDVLAPAISLLKTIPVASFAVLLLIWWGSSFLAVAISFLVVLPQIYIGTLQGLRTTDRELLEMAAVFRLPWKSRFFYIYLPALKPFMLSSMEIALGMCWKSGVAAEVIGIPAHSIGGNLYLSKIYLDTAGVFAWTAVVILLSVLFEKIVLSLTKRFFGLEVSCGKPPCEDNVPAITVRNLTKGFGAAPVLQQLTEEYEPGKIYYLRQPSGSGKTTFLKILAGLVEPDQGLIERPGSCSMVFQEDRLCMKYSGVKNVELVTGDREHAEKALRKLLEEENLEKPCELLSGGMKRRVALVRAMEADSSYVLLDEPFAGMDSETRKRAEAYIAETQRGRTIIIATHI